MEELQDKISERERMMTSKYPDITDLLEAKARRRRELAALTWEEKVAIVRQMQFLLPKGVWGTKPILPPTVKTQNRQK